MNICSCDLTALVNILRHFCIIGTTGNNNRMLGSLRKKTHKKVTEREKCVHSHFQKLTPTLTPSFFDTSDTRPPDTEQAVLTDLPAARFKGGSWVRATRCAV